MGKAKYNLNQNGSGKVKTEKDVNSEKPEAGTFRTILPQILASTAKNFLLLDLGMAVAFPTAFPRIAVELQSLQTLSDTIKALPAGAKGRGVWRRLHANDDVEGPVRPVKPGAVVNRAIQQSHG